MNYIKIKKHDISNGPGVRVSLYVSGCTHHCKNCFNPETWNFNAGNIFNEDIRSEVIKSLEPSYIKGLSLLGGEPFEPQNHKTLIHLVSTIRKLLPEKTIWCYTGYKYDEDILNGKLGDSAKELLSLLDVLVDGEFVEEEKVIDLRFRGSLNQRIIDVKKSLEENRIILWTD